MSVETFTVPADGFLPEATLELWTRAGVAVRNGAVVALRDGRTFALVDGVRILGRRDGESDPYSLTGRVVSLGTLLKRGGTLTPQGVRLGAATYDVEFGSIVQDCVPPVFPG